MALRLCAVLWVSCLAVIWASPSHPRWQFTGIRETTNENGETVKIRRSEPHEIQQAELTRRLRCRCQCRSKYHQDDWHCCDCVWTDEICFPGSATVQLDTGSDVTMAELRPGNRVLTASDDGELVYSEVRTFMKRNVHELGAYMRIETSSGQEIALSRSHVIFASKTNNTKEMRSVFAQDLEVGDYVFIEASAHLQPAAIVSIYVDIMEGVYVPLTEHGTLLVDGVYTSCYAAFDHQVAHVAMSPLRWFPGVFDPFPLQEGLRSYVYVIKEIGRWLLPEGIQDKPSRGWSHLVDLVSW